MAPGNRTSEFPPLKKGEAPAFRPIIFILAEGLPWLE